MGVFIIKFKLMGFFESDVLNLQSSGRGKRVKSNEDEKSKEVVHVRARRGQATDSHSLAERVRFLFF